MPMQILRERKCIMKRTWLIQRLLKPKNNKIFAAFSFGGGLKNGGLTDEAMELLGEILSFDYMGAAEFEWGAVPEALRCLAKTKELSKHSIIIQAKDIKDRWPPREGEKYDDTEVFVVCNKEQKDEVDKVIRSCFNSSLELKEPAYAALAVNKKCDPYRDIQGWLELDNGFFFSINKDMWEKMCKLFSYKEK